VCRRDIFSGRKSTIGFFTPKKEGSPCLASPAFPQLLFPAHRRQDQVSTGLMLVAAIAVCTAAGAVRWYWNFGGFEYLIFWAICSLAVFVGAWREHPGLFGFGRAITL
jgi:hypothetical protein